MRKRAAFYSQLAAAVVLAAALRFWGLDLCVWRKDQAEAWSRALDFAREGRFPWRGLDASVGRPNPPGFIWMLAAPARLSGRPEAGMALVAGLGALAVVFTALAARRMAGERAAILAAALQAASPWAVAYDHALWAQSLLPFFSSLALWLMFEWLRRPRGWPAAGALFVLLFMPQIHFSAAALPPVFALAIVLGVWRGRPAWRSFALWTGAAAALGAALWAPYVLDRRWAKGDPDRDRRASSANWFEHGPAVVPPDNLAPDSTILVFPNVVASTMNIHGSGFMEFWVGFSNFTLHTRRPLWKTYEALVSVCLILAAVSASGLYRRRRRWRPSPRLAMAWVALLWMAAPGAALCGLIQLNYPHYFAVCLPAGYLLIARLAAVLDRAPGKPPWERAFRLAPLACLAFALTLLFCLGQDLARDGGFMGGEYGRSYRTMAMGDAPWAWEEASRESGEGR